MPRLAASQTQDPGALIGAALRSRRKELGLTMQAVADAAGLSVGFISQVERGISAPSLSSLAGLSEVLDTPMGDFLSQPATDGQTTRHDGRVVYSVDRTGPSYERISTRFPGSQLRSVIVHEPPGHRSEPISHRGEEMFYVLAGEVTVEIEGRVEVLRAGDSIHFDSTRVHSTWNHTGEAVSFLWCGTMDVFGDGTQPIHKNAPADGAHTDPATGEPDE